MSLHVKTFCKDWVTLQPCTYIQSLMKKKHFMAFLLSRWQYQCLGKSCHICLNLLLLLKLNFYLVEVLPTICLFAMNFFLNQHLSTTTLHFSHKVDLYLTATVQIRTAQTCQNMSETSMLLAPINGQSGQALIPIQNSQEIRLCHSLYLSL